MRVAVFFSMGGALVAIAYARTQPGLGWQHYVDARFQFAIDIPVNLVKVLLAPANDDGREFMSLDGRARGNASGGFNVLNETLVDVADQEERRCVGGRSAYRVVRANFMVVSCQMPGGRTFYARSFTRGDEDVLANFWFDYPRAEQAKWDPIVTRMSRSFSPTLGR